MPHVMTSFWAPRPRSAVHVRDAQGNPAFGIPACAAQVHLPPAPPRPPHFIDVPLRHHFCQATQISTPHPPYHTRQPCASCPPLSSRFQNLQPTHLSSVAGSAGSSQTAPPIQQGKATLQKETRSLGRFSPCRCGRQSKPTWGSRTAWRRPVHPLTPHRV